MAMDAVGMCQQTTDKAAELMGTLQPAEAEIVGCSDAVLASCAVPWIFAPVRIGGREYVDGGVWSPTNLDAAPVGRGARVLFLAPLLGGPWPAMRAASSAALRVEALRVRARVQTVGPDDASNRAMGPNLMDSGPRPAVLAAGYAQGRRLAGA